MVWACREKTGRLCSEESRPDGEKTNNLRQRKKSAEREGGEGAVERERERKGARVLGKMRERI